MQLQSGSIFKWVDEKTGKVHFDLQGSVTFHNLVVTLKVLFFDYSLDTEGLEIPIPGNCAITATSGSATVPADIAMKLLPGASVVVNSGVTLDLNGKLYVYSVGSEQNHGVSFSNGLTAWKDGHLLTYPTGGNNSTAGSYRRLPELGYTATTAAEFRVEGTLNINAGATFGGELTGAAGGMVNIASGASLSGSIKEDLDGTANNLFTSTFTAVGKINGTVSNFAVGTYHYGTNGWTMA